MTKKKRKTHAVMPTGIVLVPLPTTEPGQLVKSQ